jgi:hypothetical protein
MVVAAAAAIGVAVALVMSGGKAPESWVATQRIAVYPVPNSIAKDLKPAAVIAAAGTPAVLRAVESTLALPAGKVVGSISARADNTDPSVVLFSATAPSEAEASALLAASVDAARTRALSAYAFAVGVALEEAKTYDAYVADLKQRLNDLDRLAVSAAPAQKAALTQSQALYIQQVHDFEARALVARHSTEYVDAAIVKTGEPTVVRSSNTRVKFGLLLQGLIAGLSIGVIVASGREWARARRVA